MEYFKGYACRAGHCFQHDDEICRECGDDLRECVAKGRHKMTSHGRIYFDLEFVRWRSTKAPKIL